MNLTEATIDRLRAQGVKEELLQRVQEESNTLLPPMFNVKLTPEAERRLLDQGIDPELIQRVKDDWDGSVSGIVRPDPEEPERGKFNRTEYMRQYMADKRAGVPAGQRGKSGNS